MKRKDFQALLILAAIIGIFPWAAGGNQYFISLLVFLGLNAMATMGLSLLMGYAGQISLGHAAFFGIGAYASGILTTKYALPPLGAFFCGIIF
jgi:branched-chain amino acid transport system permease protein